MSDSCDSEVEPRLTTDYRNALNPNEITYYCRSYNQKLWMRDLLKGATYPPS